MADKAVKNQIKREPVTIRMKQDSHILGRSLAKILFGSEEKLGDLIEESLFFYSAHREDEARASALLQQTEERILRRIGDNFQAVYKDLVKKENKMVERIAGLQAVGAFEVALVELMLKDKMVKTEQEKLRYEELRSKAAARMKDRLVKAGAEQMAELHEHNQSLEQKIIELNNQITKAISTIKTQNNELEQTKATIQSKSKTLEQLTENIKRQENLINWYDRRDRSIPDLQERNKGVFGKMKYEDALNLFEKENPKPKV